MANTSIRKTFSGNGNRKKWTLSWWEKKNKLGTVQRIFSCDDSSSNADDFFQWQTDDKLVMGFYNSGYYANLTPDRNFRDANGWYHFVFTWDTAQATASNRAKFYVNGVQETVFATATYPSQNADSFINTTESLEIGKRSYNDTQFLESTLSHVHFTDGYAYSASDFGSTDSTTGEWKINTSPSVSYGTNGFWILKDGNTITDSSPNSNNWSSVSGTLTKTEDCPSNVFATMNPLDNYWQGGTFTEGNNTVKHGSSQWTYNTSTLKIPENSKFYFEAKVISMNQCTIGIEKNVSIGSDDYLGKTSGVGFRGNQGNVYKNGSDAGGTFATYTANDIISVACDTVNNRIFFGKNGTWLNSGDPTSSTGAITIDDDRDYFFALGDNTSGARGKWSANFGNGYFGTTAVSSAGTNASGNGIFEYNVPAGYTALSTKGLNL